MDCRRVITARPARHGSSEPLTRELYTDDAGVTLVESVLIKGLGHAFPIRPTAPHPAVNLALSGLH
jgi:hypothetical protein